MIIAIEFLLLLLAASSPCVVGSKSNSGSIKICVVDSSTDDSWLATIDSIALFIAKNHLKAPQVYNQGDKEMCEFVGSVDRAKQRPDFILVVKKHNTTEFNCDPEWGRHSFAILNIDPDEYKPIKKAYGNAHFSGKVAFSSDESTLVPSNWTSVNNTKQLLNRLRGKFLSPQSRIPDEYPFKAEREERVKRRTLKAVIALMGLAVCSLLVIMFLGSLSRYNESKKVKEQEMERKKKHEQQASGANSNPHSKKTSDASEKSEKKSEATKSAKSGKTEKSSKTKKDEEKELLIDKSKKSAKSEEKSSKKE